MDSKVKSTNGNFVVISINEKVLLRVLVDLFVCHSFTQKFVHDFFVKFVDSCKPWENKFIDI